MIRVRLTPTMLATLDLVGCRKRLLQAADCPSGAAFDCDHDTVDAIRSSFATVLAAPETTPRVRLIARRAIERCEKATAHAAAKLHEIPISITVPEQEAIAALSADECASIAPDVAARLERRQLVEWIDPAHAFELTPRGLAVAAGTPPGDLVPFPFLRRGVRVRLLHTTTDDFDNDIAAGTELVVLDAKDGRLELAPSLDAEPVLTRAHPLIALVVARS